MSSSLVRKCSVKAGELWIPEMSNYTMENHAITNETALAKMSLRQPRSPLSGSISVDYLCKYIATSSTKADAASISSNISEPLDCHSFSRELDEESSSSQSSLQESRFLGLPELEESDQDGGYVSFPPVDEIPDVASINSARTLLESISNSIRPS
ncbi:hypothetical protein K493DRAFT_320776 [Basidiobolus meristosporus CBS 931.73]|uniref:Uncharacterized protein n=1 Tax=Basidiobolus meristosporus CBS 931.73 TaxID=1314790 RepID=A0A1Y1X5R2_9FUNG|nr:hypothetical protein K493DRAFT_320776 [Basidiobolus meristosporus CBS 931.73]|eukprot:ORX80988.1 hypothetical protein K493DRAFT_320776 [Basidiobolus meristosporus CBS 931.73]